MKNNRNLFFPGNAWSDINSRFGEKFTLSPSVWNKYVYETINQQSGEDNTECGIRCELSAFGCDFFLTASGKCYLAKYSHYGSGTVADNSEVTTYHKYRKLIPHNVDATLNHCYISAATHYHIWSPYYDNMCDCKTWYKWTYQIYPESGHSRRCQFECHHDNDCDFYVNVHGYCIHGRYSYTGSPATYWTDNTCLRFKKGMLAKQTMLILYE